ARTLDGLLHGLQMGSARPATRLSAPQTRPEGTRPRNAVDNSVDKSSSALWIMLWISRDVEGGGDCGGLKRSRFRTRSESYPQCAESLSVRRSNHYAGVSRSRSAAAPRTAHPMGEEGPMSTTELGPSASDLPEDRDRERDAEEALLASLPYRLRDVVARSPRTRDSLPSRGGCADDPQLSDATQRVWDAEHAVAQAQAAQYRA